MKARSVLVAAVVAGCQGSQGAALPSAPRPPLATTLVKQIDVTPGKQVLAPGHTVQLMAAVYMLDGQITANVNWASSDDTVATVDSHTGLVTAIKEGLVTITARSVLEPKRLGLCTLLVSTCASCSVPLAPRVDAGVGVTDEERSALQAVLQPYKLEVVDADRSYVLNEKGKVPERELMAENEAMASLPAEFPTVAAAPRTAWLSVYPAINGGGKIASNGYYESGSGNHSSLYPTVEVKDFYADRGLSMRVLFYTWDGSWVKDIRTQSGARLFVDDLPLNVGLVGRAVFERRGRIHETWTKPFVLTQNRVTAANNLALIPQMDFNLVVGNAW